MEGKGEPELHKIDDLFDEIRIEIVRGFITR
jgi:hypothetical protein